jgi:hypothetical protein
MCVLSLLRRKQNGNSFLFSLSKKDKKGYEIYKGSLFHRFYKKKIKIEIKIEINLIV